MMFGVRPGEGQRLVPTRLLQAAARAAVVAVFVSLALLAASCRQSGDSLSLGRTDTPQGRLLLWHTWTEADARVLDELINTYMELHPQAKIVAVAVDEDEIFKAVADGNESGLGPDLLLVDAGTLFQLSEAGLVRELSNSDLDFSSVSSGPLRMVSDNQSIYGLPFASNTHVLFYNRTRVTEAPTDFWEWLERTQAGERFALDTSFIGAFWGIGAYHGGTIDDATREILIGLGGFKNWLEALQLARTIPNFILDDDPNTLRASFVSGDADFYFGDSSELPGLRAAFGHDAVGVATLPHGPSGGTAAPLLHLSVFAFSDASSHAEYALARDLATFLTGAEAQLSLAWSDVGRMPTNNQVRMSTGMPTSVTTLARQIAATRSIRFADQEWWRQVQDTANNFMGDQQAVVEGVLSPDEMIERTIRSLTESQGLTVRTIDPASLCPDEPTAIEAWHALGEAEAAALAEISAQYAATCPGAQVAFTFVPYAEIYDRFVAEATDGNGPALFFESSAWLPQLAEQELIQNIGERIEMSSLQQIQPRALRMMSFNDRLYGIPESVTPLALYYNTDLVADPPLDVHILLQSIDLDRRWALPVGFSWGFWGMMPFGTLARDNQTGNITDATGLTEWLTWLQTVDKRPGVDLYFDWREAEDAFLAGDAAYFVSGPWSLPRVRDALGDDGFRVVPLPNGPHGPASPMLQVQGSMLNINADEAESQTALAFAQFINLDESQERLLATGQHVSASVTVDLEEYPNLAGFQDQARVASMVIENMAFSRMQTLGDALYRAVLLDGAEPAPAVAAFVSAVNSANEADAGQLPDDALQTVE